MDIILGLFFISILVFARPQREKIKYFSVNSILPVRGIMAVAIILHHISEKSPVGKVFPFMQHMGYLIVAVFFFFSGYGLLCSYNKKGKEYLNGFLKKRVLYLLLVLVFVSLIYSVYYLILGEFKFSFTIAKNSWYMWVLIYCYLFFFFSFKFFGEKSKILSIALVFVLQTILLIIFKLYNFENYHYISNYAFTAGMLFCYFKEKFDILLKKNYLIVTLVSFLLFFLFSAASSRIGLYDYCRMLSTIAFCLIIVVVLYQVSIAGKIWSFLGTISLEIYLMHGLVYNLALRFISNTIISSVVTLVLTIPVAYLVSFVNKKLKTFCS